MDDFKESVEKVRNSKPKTHVDNKVKLHFYALYKQATVGDNRSDKPSIFNTVGKAKWDAWNSKKGMKREVAMRQYTLLTSKFY